MVDTSDRSAQRRKAAQYEGCRRRSHYGRTGFGSDLVRCSLRFAAASLGSLKGEPSWHFAAQILHTGTATRCT